MAITSCSFSVPNWAEHFIEHESPYFGWTKTLSSTIELIQKYEVQTGSSFIIETVRRSNFGNYSVTTELQGHHIRFEDSSSVSHKIVFDGVPFIVANIKRLECHRGKQRKKILIVKEEHDYNKKRRRVLKPSKKVNCKAHITVREIIRFPEFSISSNTKWRKERASKKIREAFKEKTFVRQEKRFYISLPKKDDHIGHKFDACEGSTQKIDKHLILNNNGLVSEEVDSTVSFLNCYLKLNCNEWFEDDHLPLSPNDDDDDHLPLSPNEDDYHLPLSPNEDDETIKMNNTAMLPTYSASDCRVLINELHSSTYLIEDSDILNELHQKLQSVDSWIYEKISAVSSLSLVKETTNRTKKKKIENKTVPEKLPLRRKRKAMGINRKV